MQNISSFLTLIFLLFPTSVSALTDASSYFEGVQDPLTVSDAVYAIVELNGGIINNWDEQSTSMFNDVQSSHKRFEHFLEISKEGWLDCMGKSNCYIQPDQPITRGQLSYILLRNAYGVNNWKSMGTGQSPAFHDLTQLHEYYDYIRVAVQRCILPIGKTGNIYPDGTVNRLQAIEMANNAFNSGLMTYDNDCKVEVEDLELTSTEGNSYFTLQTGDAFELSGVAHKSTLSSVDLHGVKKSQLSCGDDSVSGNTVTWLCTALNPGYEPSTLYFTTNNSTSNKSNPLVVKIIPGNNNSISSVSPKSSSSSAVSRDRRDPITFDTDIATLTDANPFPDLPSGSLVGKAASALRTLGIIGGYPDGQFKGDRPVNRAEAAKMLMLASQTPDSVNLTFGRFPDVKKSDWFGRYVMTAASNNVIAGYPDGTFKPANTINTAEFLKMITRAFNAPENMAHSYVDVPPDAWFNRFAGTAQKYDLFPGRSQKLLPASTLSRSDVAIAIYQYLLNK